MNISKQDDGVWGENELKNEKEGFKKWIHTATGNSKPCVSSSLHLKPGVYSVTFDNHDDLPIFKKVPLASDALISPKGSLIDEVLGEARAFWDNEKNFTQLGIVQKRGFLLYGPQGTGKSSIVNTLIYDHVERKGVVLLCDNPRFFGTGLGVFRQVEPTTPLLCVFEDIDSIISKYGDDEILQILDGAKQIPFVLNIATTNYPEKLDARIVSRPRRFDRIYKVMPPGDIYRKAFFKEKLPKKESVDEWVKMTDGLSFAALTELMVSVFCLNQDRKTTVKLLRQYEESTPKTTTLAGTKIGF